MYHLEAYGLMRVPVLLDAARDTGSTAPVEPAVSGITSTLDWRTDNGRPTDPAPHEGVHLRRQQSLDCLYGLTHDRLLSPIIVAVARANLDPRRYCGPPEELPHNHGLIATIALQEAGRLLERRGWRHAAVARLQTAVRASFTPAGLTIEQLSSDHVTVIMGWTAATRRLRRLGSAEELALAAEIDTYLLRARRALAFLLMPNAVPVDFGGRAAGTQCVVAQR